MNRDAVRDSFDSDLPGYLPGTTKRARSVTSDWTVLRDLIDGVSFKEVRNVPKGNGVVTEVYRRDWGLDALVVDQVFQVAMFPGAISAWHMHRDTTDRLFVNQGMARLVLYDARTESSTTGRVNEFVLGAVRPGIVSVPPGVWHGVQALGGDGCSLLNLVDVAYRYEDPDHWALPWDSDRIPYRFQAASIGP